MREGHDRARQASEDRQPDPGAGCAFTHKVAKIAMISLNAAVTLPIGLQSWTHTFANEPQECPLSAQKGLGVAFIALCL